MNFLPGSYVTHARLPELGNGEIMNWQDGKMKIRFASGERSFQYELVAPHLSATNEGPVRPPPKAARRAAKPKAKAKAKA